MAPRSDEPSHYDHYCGEVEAMLAVGYSLRSVERMLARAPLEPDQRSALWLLAWALQDSLDEAEPVELILVDEGAREARVRP